MKVVVVIEMNENKKALPRRALSSNGNATYKKGQKLFHCTTIPLFERDGES
jgi:hypothetical protein